MDDTHIQANLDRIDWDFPGALSNYGLHRLHWYPGTFIPQIPAFLIDLFSEVGDTVLDPFCGIGTTLVEAVRLGRRAVGVDVNPIAVMVARAKLTFVGRDALIAKCKVLECRVAEWRAAYGVSAPGGTLFSGHAPAPVLANSYAETLRSWYHPDTWREMVFLHDLIGRETGAFRGLLNTLFSQIAKPCSSQRNHWGYVADNMVPRQLVYEDALAAFTRGLREAIDAFDSFLENPALRGKSVSELNALACVYRSDLLVDSVLAESSVDLIVTSPPYPNVTDYTRCQRLSLWWFEEPVDELRKPEIGARFKRGRRAAMQDYLSEMEQCFAAIVRALRPNRHLCLVVGESNKHREKLLLVDRLREMVCAQGCEEAFTRIKRTRTRERIRSRDGAENAEFIMIFRRR